MWKNPRHRSAPRSFIHRSRRLLHTHVLGFPLVNLVLFLCLFRHWRLCRRDLLLRGFTRCRHGCRICSTGRRGVTRWRLLPLWRGATRSRISGNTCLVSPRRGATRSRCDPRCGSQLQAPRLCACSCFPWDTSHSQQKLCVTPAVLVQPSRSPGPDNSHARAKDMLVATHCSAQVDAVPPVFRELVLMWAWFPPRNGLAKKHDFLGEHPPVMSFKCSSIVSCVQFKSISYPRGMSHHPRVYAMRDVDWHLVEALH